MKTDLTVELYAIAAGVEGNRGVGQISHDLQITTETDNLLIPVAANILYFTPHLHSPDGATSSLIILTLLVTMQQTVLLIVSTQWGDHLL